MGQVLSASDPVKSIKPDSSTGITFDPMYGFPNGRKPRVMKATDEEMEAAKMPLTNRDYCAHVLLDYYKCRRDVFPWIYKCHDEKHHYEHCLFEDHILRMKEYEREKRLLQRQKRKELLAI